MTADGQASRGSSARSRRRVLSSVALAVAGVLLGAGGVAWRTHTTPFADAPCWGSLTDQDLDQLFGGWDTDAAQIRPSWTPRGQGSLDGRCRIASHRRGEAGRQVDIRLHALAGLRDDNVDWSDQFLSSRLTPLGGGLLGMASDTRAWVALPSSCVEPSQFSGPAVVDVSMGDDEIKNSEDPKENATFQSALARTAVHAANAAMRRLDCSGSLPAPGETLPVPDFRSVGADRALCGIDGVRLPKEHVGSGARMRMSVGKHSPVRTCDIVSGQAARPQYRLRTVQEPDLTGAVITAALDSGPAIRRTGDSEAVGSYSPTLAAVYAKCPKDTVVFIAQQNDGTHGYTFIRQVFPSYVAAETKRLGCTPLEIRIPG